MELVEFLRETHAQVQADVGDRLVAEGGSYPYEESVFTEIVMQHMSEIGMTFEPKACHYTAKVGNANLRLSGFAVSEDDDQLDLFVSLYDGSDELSTVSDTETKTAAEQCVRFLKQCAEAKLARTMDESNDAYELAVVIQECYDKLDQIRVYVLTDKQAKAKNFKPQEIKGKTVKLEVMDIERLHRHWSEGKPRDELVVNFQEVSGSALPCVYVRGEMADYDYALTILPGEALRFLYEKYGARLLEANVRSFLSAATKVNKGIAHTLKNEPEKFMAYNNGIVLIADEAQLSQTADGGPGILWLKGMQIVNGGQTTASIYFTRKKNPAVDLSKVRIPAKLIILRNNLDPEQVESLISDVSKYANSQTAVKMSDLSANKPFHVTVENLSNSTYCPDGVGRWFYERAAGSYNVMLTRQGTTVAKLAKIKMAVPKHRKIIKTDLAKFLNAWEQQPDLVSYGGQKNFERFMDRLTQQGGRLPDVADYKHMIAKAIVFKKTELLVQPLFKAFKSCVTNYLVALLSHRVGERFDFDRVWLKQDLSPDLQHQLRVWAPEVSQVLHRSADSRMVSEWAKKPDCWRIVKEASYSALADDIPEIKKAVLHTE